MSEKEREKGRGERGGEREQEGQELETGRKKEKEREEEGERERQAFCFWFQSFCGKLKLTARSFKEPNDKGLSSALLQHKINRPKQQRFVLEIL